MIPPAGPACLVWVDKARSVGWPPACAPRDQTTCTEPSAAAGPESPHATPPPYSVPWLLTLCPGQCLCRQGAVEVHCTDPLASGGWALGSSGRSSGVRRRPGPPTARTPFALLAGPAQGWTGDGAGALPLYCGWLTGTDIRADRGPDRTANKMDGRAEAGTDRYRQAGGRAGGRADRHCAGF